MCGNCVREKENNEIFSFCPVHNPPHACMQHLLFHLAALFLMHIHILSVCESSNE